MKTLLTLIGSLLFGGAAHAQTQSHWQALADPGNSASRFEDVYFVDSLTGFAVALNDPGFYKTTNGGYTWTSKPAMSGARLRSVEFLDDGQTGFAGGLQGSFTGPYLTTDGGETWENIFFRFPLASTTTNRVCGWTHQGDTIIGVGWWGSNVASVYISRDKGASWETKLLADSLATGLVDAATMPNGIIFISGGMNLFGSSNSIRSVILRSQDGGRTWKTVFRDATIGGRIWKLQFLNDKVGFGSIEPLLRDTVAMVKTVDGGSTWHIVGAGEKDDSSFGSWQTQGIGFINEREGWMGGYYAGLFHSTDSGKTWKHELYGSNFNRFFRMDSTLMYAGGKALYRWSKKSPDMPHPPHSMVLLPHVLHPATPNPSNGEVNIVFNLRNKTNVVLDVVSMDGRASHRIVSETLAAGHHHYTWDGRNMPAGNYLIWLGTDEIPIVQRFVLRH